MFTPPKSVSLQSEHTTASSLALEFSVNSITDQASLLPTGADLPAAHLESNYFATVAYYALLTFRLDPCTALYM